MTLFVCVYLPKLWLFKYGTYACASVHKQNFSRIYLYCCVNDFALRRLQLHYTMNKINQKKSGMRHACTAAYINLADSLGKDKMIHSIKESCLTPFMRVNLCSKPSTKCVCIVFFYAWQSFKLASLSLKREQWWNNLKDGGTGCSLNITAQCDPHM